LDRNTLSVAETTKGDNDKLPMLVAHFPLKLNPLRGQQGLPLYNIIYMYDHAKISLHCTGRVARRLPRVVLGADGVKYTVLTTMVSILQRGYIKHGFFLFRLFPFPAFFRHFFRETLLQRIYTAGGWVFFTEGLLQVHA
jgi:hypothetical protein